MRRAIEKRYRDSHPEYRQKVAERVARWKAANRDKVNAQANARYAAKTAGKPRTAPRKHADIARAWRIANPDKARLADKKYRDSHKEKHAAKIKKWRNDNPEKARANKRTWNAANRSSCNERTKRWAKANPEKARAIRVKSSKTWAEKHPEQRSVIRVRAHAKRKSRGRSAGSFTLAEWKQLLDDTGHKCLCCGIDESRAIYRYPKAGQPLIGRLTRDHIMPLSQGGAGTIDNIAPLCLPCNTRKHAKHIDYRAQHAGNSERRTG